MGVEGNSCRFLRISRSMRMATTELPFVVRGDQTPLTADL
jgi:hypothetical protein